MNLEELNIKMFGGAAAYLNTSRRPLDQKLSQAVSEALNGSNVSSFLDVGCGVGFLTRLLHKIYPDAVGVGLDASPELIAMANSTNEASGITFSEGNVYEVNVEDDTYDLTACQTLFIHLASPQKALNEMRRVTKPNGTLLFIEPVIPGSGMLGYVPAVGAVKKNLRDKLHQFDVTQKFSEGIDMGIALKLPSLLLEVGATDVKVDSVNLVHFSTESLPSAESPPETTSFDEFMLKLGYDKGAMHKLKAAEQQLPQVRGEIGLFPLLIITATP